MPLQSKPLSPEATETVLKCFVHFTNSSTNGSVVCVCVCVCVCVHQIKFSRTSVNRYFRWSNHTFEGVTPVTK